MSDLERCTQEVERLCGRIHGDLLHWSQQVAAALRWFLDADSLGVAFAAYRRVEPCQVQTSAVVGHGLDAHLDQLACHVLVEPSAHTTVMLYTGSAIGPASRPALGDTAQAIMRTTRVADLWFLSATDMDQAGIAFVGFRAQPFRPSDAEWVAMAQIQRQLTQTLQRRAATREGRARTTTPTVTQQTDEYRTLYWSDSIPAKHRPSFAAIESLSPREREVLSLLADVGEPKAIAYELGVAHSTVRVLLARIANKLGIDSGAELRASARDILRTLDVYG